MTVEERFWSAVDRSGECWAWVKATNAYGYGHFAIRHGTVKRAHRYAWELINGPIPKGLYVLHSCDNRRCVNPAHLRLGTQADNIRDCLSRGRFALHLGEHSGMAKLTNQDVIEIRRRYVRGTKGRSNPTTAQIAADFGVTIETVHNVGKRKTWRHLSQPL